MTGVSFFYAAGLGSLAVVIRRPFYELLKEKDESTPDLFWQTPLLLGLFYYYSRHRFGSRDLDLIAIATEVGSVLLLIGMVVALHWGMTAS